MNSAVLVEVADLLADDLTVGVGGAPGLGVFFDTARPVDDDCELLAVCAALLRLRNLADHGLARASATLERTGVPRRKHVRSAAAILIELGAAPSAAYRFARLSRAVDETAVETVTRGMRDGAVSAEFADAVIGGLGFVRGRVELTEDEVAQVVRSLRVQSSPARVWEKARSWALILAPTDLDDDQVPVAEREELNELTLVQTDDGRMSVTVDLDVVAGEELSAALDPLTRPVPEPDGTPDRRSVKRRRAQALAEVVRTYLSRSERPTLGRGIATRDAARPGRRDRDGH